MNPALKAARDINALWIECLDKSKIDLAMCPSDEQVAEIIDRHFPTKSTGEI